MRVEHNEMVQLFKRPECRVSHSIPGKNLQVPQFEKIEACEGQHGFVVVYSRLMRKHLPAISGTSTGWILRGAGGKLGT
jgi:hypothetical protein